MDFDLTTEQTQLRDAVSALGRRYGHEYFVAKAKAGEHTTELWDEAGKLGYLGVNVPASTAVAAAGSPSWRSSARSWRRPAARCCCWWSRRRSSARCSARHGTEAQRAEFLPGIADGSLKVVFAITEPEAGSNFHRLGTVARRDGDDWVLSGRKCFISGVDEAPVRAGRRAHRGRRPAASRRCSWCPPTRPA